MSEVAWSKARELAFECGSRGERESVVLTDAIGRTLWSDLHALTDLPAHRSSAMDGWAVRGAGPWQVIGAIRAGSTDNIALNQAQAVAIATGAAVPDEATAVIRSEDATLIDNLLHGHAEPNQHIRPAGEEATIGDLLIPAGTRLTPLHIGLAAAAGHDRLDLVRRPRVRIAIFGDELLRTGRPEGGRIRDSLGPQLPTWMQSWGCAVTDLRFVPDDFEAHTAALAPSNEIDLIVTTGGTAHGPVDFLHDAIRERSGTLIVDGVDCRPGHPMLLAQWPTHHLIGLPGNPQAAIAALHTLAAPLIRASLGMSLPELPSVTFAGTAKRRDRETRLIPCTLNQAIATPVAHIGSGMLRGLAEADGFAVLTGESAAWLALQAL